MPVSPSTICSWMPPTRLATTGRAFHIASATVSPKPSARLFCTTTSARRCRALTIAAFSSTSSIGSENEVDAVAHRRGQLGAARGRPRRAPRAPSGSSATAARRRARRARGGRRVRRAMPSREGLASTPSGSLRRSQRETWITAGASAAAAAIRTSSARAVDPPRASVAPAEHRLRPAGAPASRPADAQDRRDHVGARISWFLAENASIDGGITRTRAGSRPSQTYASREKTTASAGAHVRAQELPRRVRAAVRLVDADVAAPDDVRAGGAHRLDQPGGLRVVQQHDVAGPRPAARARARCGRASSR